MLKFSRQARFAGAFTLLALLGLAGTPLLFDRAMSELRARTLEAGDADDALSSAISSLALEISAVRGFALTGDESLLAEYREARERRKGALLSLRGLDAVDRYGFRPAVTAFETAVSRWAQLPERLITRGAPQGDYAQEIASQQELYRTALRAGRDLERDLDRFVRLQRAQISNWQTRWRRANVLLAALAAACALIIVHSLRRTLAQGELARRDPLTALLNRRGFEELAQTLMQRSERDKETSTLLVFDLDGFKAVNDTLGHGAGDDLLRDLATALSKIARKADIIGRLGGDEFAVLMPGVDEAAAHPAVGRLRDAVQSALTARNWRVTLSVGALTFSPGEGSIPDLCREADQLMYDAKQGGKNSIRFSSRQTPA